MVIKQANWVKSSVDFGDACPVFRKTFPVSKKVKDSKLYISALGVYEAKLNGQRVGAFVLAPGWTSYENRVQFQEYTVTGLLGEQNTLDITLGKGWCFSELGWNKSLVQPYTYPAPAIICALHIVFDDGTEETIVSDESFMSAKSNILFSEIYHGETYDANLVPENWGNAIVCDYPRELLIPQQGEVIREIEELRPQKLIVTPKGERVIDFGQNLTGYVAFRTHAPKGTILELSHAEVLAADGSFYTENLRTARQKITYIANGETAEYKPHFTFQGFRYIRLDQWTDDVSLDDFKAIVVHSEMKRTGYFSCSNEKVNRLFSNIVWGQRDNFLDVPTDCPQRDERLGWTGDAQVFVRTASYNYNVQKFFAKWLADMALEQFDDGGIPAVIPNVLGHNESSSSAWGDAAVICPWQLYLTYGNKSVLSNQFDCMKRWVDYIRRQGENEFLWNTGHQYGDHLSLEQTETRKDLIATAYFAYSTQLLVKAGSVLGKDMTEYEVLYEHVAAAFREHFMKDGRLVSDTQTAHALALYFDLCGAYREAVARNLAKLITDNGNRLATGFVGTPYLLHALSQNGYADIAYSLLLQEAFPSWLYAVNKGATTMWEHWDGIREDGSFWRADMNSFNHYAYGAVADWMYGAVCGINADEAAPGFENVFLKPQPDRRLRYAEASIDTKYGRLSSKWSIVGNIVTYEFEVPNRATITLGEYTYTVSKGKYHFSFGFGEDGSITKIIPECESVLLMQA